ncbi:type III-B CRISPR module RAMP protein Cmr6, partial [Thermococcus sp.]
FTQLLQKCDEKFRSLDFFELAKGVQDSLDEGKRTINGREIPSGKVKEKPKVFKGKTLSEIFTLLVETFGTRKKQGNVIFFDALPCSSSLKLELDIMNPHHPEYYQENKPPGDWQTPNPIFFLAVPKGVGFLISVAPKNSDSKLAQIAFEILKVALEDMGVGAKTSLGYGRLKFGGERHHERKDA